MDFVAFREYYIYNKNKKSVLFDISSILHLISGILTYNLIYLFFPKWKTIWRLLFVFLLHSIYELKDAAIHYNLIENPQILKFLYIFGSPPNTFINSVGDTIAFMVGCIISIKYMNIYNKTLLNKTNTLITIFIILVLFINGVKWDNKNGKGKNREKI
tara:strand:+ start:116 stop:589 length:474 start_codon:yes stop_codon:yes gene_type:complete